MGRLNASLNWVGHFAVRDLPDMMSASEGVVGSWKSRHNKGGCLNFQQKSDPNANKGEGVKKSENSANITSGSCLWDDR